MLSISQICGQHNISEWHIVNSASHSLTLSVSTRSIHIWFLTFSPCEYYKSFYLFHATLLNDFEFTSRTTAGSLIWHANVFMPDCDLQRSESDVQGPLVWGPHISRRKRGENRAPCCPQYFKSEAWEGFYKLKWSKWGLSAELDFFTVSDSSSPLYLRKSVELWLQREEGGVCGCGCVCVHALWCS